MNAPHHSKKSEAETKGVLEAQVDKAIATCGGDVRAALRATQIANAYLDAEIERLTEAISTGFARVECARHLTGEVDGPALLGAALVTITIDQFPVSHVGRLQCRQQLPSSMRT